MRELESTFAGRTEWKWVSECDDIPRLCSELEEIASRTYQRGLGTGFFDNHEFQQRLGLFANRNLLRLALFLIDGKVRAFWFGVLYNGVFHLAETGYEPDLQRYEIGTLLFAQLVDHLSGEGISALDFGIGDGHYKRRFGSERVLEASLWIFGSSLRGRLIYAVLLLFDSIEGLARYLVNLVGLTDKVKRTWRRNKLRR